ncbi:MAG: ATP-dependent sacrificial sulfur transferase LarE [Actinobacteria bacterium]|nr:ATP-dependent sacrificial sulfur transferase LarE [Actinomycetota bacterium]MCL6104880.1 ATP-dependent sacrificial sulfur transferase LarE [Actinomycetota bacterium]
MNYQTLDKDLQTAWHALAEVLNSLQRVIVAFSGGADSSLLAWSANNVLGKDNTLCVTAVSPTLTTQDATFCKNLAAQWNLQWATVVTHELDNPLYIQNTVSRCYWCKTELMSVISNLTPSFASYDKVTSDEAGKATVVLGVNLDDLNDVRPGQKAAQLNGAVFPFVQAGFDKAKIRSLSRSLGLPTWNKPQNACLASRIPHGTPINIKTLRTVEKAEYAVRQLGFEQLRVRHYDSLACIEFEVSDLPKVLKERDKIVKAVKAAGYSRVMLDLQGYRNKKI